MLTRKPVKGDRVYWPHWRAGRVAEVVKTPEAGDNLCWIREGEGEAMPFIWRFREGLNTQAIIEERPTKA